MARRKNIPSTDICVNNVQTAQDNLILSEEARKILYALQELQNSEDILSGLIRQGIISDVGTAMYEMSKNKFKLKEDFVLKVHKNKISN